MAVSQFDPHSTIHIQVQIINLATKSNDFVCFFVGEFTKNAAIYFYYKSQIMPRFILLEAMPQFIKDISRLPI